MAVLHVRNIPDDLYRHAQAIAEARGATLSSLVITLMQEAASRDLDHKRHAKAVQRIRKNLTRRKHNAGNSVVSGADLVHASRDERETEPR